MRDYAACLVSAYDMPLAGDRELPSRGNVNAFLASSPLSSGAARAATRLNTGRCVKGRNEREYASLRFATDLLRGAIFRAKT